MTFKHARWIVAPLLLAIWACNDRKLATPSPMPSSTVQHVFDQNINNDIDILFMVDDSESMLPVQNNLIANFPTFINVLKSLPNGLPNVHIGVVTSNMGAGKFSSGELGCMNPDYGNLIYQPRSPMNPDAATCAGNAINSGFHYIEAFNNGAQKNFTGDIATVFSCIAQVGAHGCGFENQLHATEAALGPNAPQGNANFLRKDAFLAVIYITNEDDCSFPDDSELVDMSSTQPGDPLGPVASFRCTEYGILCNGAKPPRSPTGELAPCTSNDSLSMTDPLHSLTPVQHYIDFFKMLKPIPNHIIISAIAAAPTHVAVTLNAMNWATLEHSCSSMNGTIGDPAVRLKQFVDAFANAAPSRGTFSSICDDSYSGAMQIIADLIGRSLGRQCIDGILAAAPGFTQPIGSGDLTHNGKVVLHDHVSCAVEDVQYPGTPQQLVKNVIPPCKEDGDVASQSGCWALMVDPMCTISQSNMQICRNGFNPDNLKNGQPKPCLEGGNTAPDGTSAVVHCTTVVPQ